MLCAAFLFLLTICTCLDMLLGGLGLGAWAPMHPITNWGPPSIVWSGAQQILVHHAHLMQHRGHATAGVAHAGLWGILMVVGGPEMISVLF